MRFQGIDVTACRSTSDGVLVIYIDTAAGDMAKDHNPDTSPRMRVYLNDGAVYESPALQSTGEQT